MVVLSLHLACSLAWRPALSRQLSASSRAVGVRTRKPLACEASFARQTDPPARRPASAATAAATLPPKPDGIVVAYKPTNWTSFDVVAKARGCLEADLKKAGHTFRRRSRLKVGHGGTLDPLAEGLLVLGIGAGCKGLEGYLKGGKAYRATARLGTETDTQDSSGAITRSEPAEHVTLAALRDAAAGLTGSILQRPPIYSALKRGGKPLHELARAGKIEEGDVEPRRVTVHSLEVSRFDAESGSFELLVDCAGGTYVRTLIVDLGRAVGSAAHMTGLVRTRVGPFRCEGDADGERADRATLVQPLRETDFGDPARYHEAMAESAEVLRVVVERRGGAGSEEQGWE